MTCKDCVHYDICTFHLTGKENKTCLNFLDKADVVERSRKMTCSKKETCLNYPQKCKNCGMTSDIINHHPMYQNKDFVEVVRCKDCVHGHEVTDAGEYICAHCNGLIGRLNGTEYCSYGERKGKEG